MGAWDVIKGIGKGALSFLPGGSLITGAFGMAEAVAEAVGGETGGKIKKGLDLISEGLTEAKEMPMTPELKADLEKDLRRHKEAIIQMELDDVDGGRDFSVAEMSSEDPYIARTRPLMVRFMMWEHAILSTAIVVFVCILALMMPNMTSIQADLIMYTLMTVQASNSAAMFSLIAMYTGNRTKEKMMDSSAPMEGLLTRLPGLFNRKKVG